MQNKKRFLKNCLAKLRLGSTLLFHVKRKLGKTGISAYSGQKRFVDGSVLTDCPLWRYPLHSSLRSLWLAPLDKLRYGRKRTFTDMYGHLRTTPGIVCSLHSSCLCCLPLTRHAKNLHDIAPGRWCRPVAYPRHLPIKRRQCPQICQEIARNAPPPRRGVEQRRRKERFFTKNETITISLTEGV